MKKQNKTGGLPNITKQILSLFFQANMKLII